ncbi:hypothetical protein GYH30_006801 [Glycine max]|nr:hypothetical protein GYH30_006801 [Glycine max]
MRNNICDYLDYLKVTTIHNKDDYVRLKKLLVYFLKYTLLEGTSD